MSAAPLAGPARLAACAAAALGLAGCNFAPRYSAPSVAVPAAFKEAAGAGGSNAGWTQASPADQSPRGEWWSVFHDPALAGLERQVAVSNQTLVAAEANYRAARAQVLAARSALFPVVTSSPEADRVRSSATFNTSAANVPGAVAPTGGSAGSILDEYDLPFAASYEFDLWGAVRNSVSAATRSAQASAADVATALLSTQAALAQDYFQIRALDTEKRILDDTVASYRQALDVTTTLYQSGIDSDEDVARAQNQVDSAVAQAMDIQVARAGFEHAIAVLIGKPPADLSVPAAPLPEAPPAIPLLLPSELLQRRPDIAAAERRVAAANAQIGIARAAYFPELTLGATGGWETTSLSRWFEWPSRFWSVGPELSATLFDFGARKALTEEAKASYDASAADYRQTVLAAFQSVEDNLEALRVLRDEAAQQRTVVASSRHVLDLAMTRFQSGIDSYLNVVTAQATLLSDREAEVEVRLRQMTAAVALVQALGGGWNAAELPQARAVAKL